MLHKFRQTKYIAAVAKGCKVSLFDFLYFHTMNPKVYREQKLSIGHIGYGGHGRRIHDIISKLYPRSQFIRYDHRADDLEKNFAEILKANCIFISSPTSTHVPYLRQLAEGNYKGFIYCEKPGIDTLDNAFELIKYVNYFSGKIQIGYHRPFTDHHKRIKEKIVEKHFGLIKSVYIHEGFGIAYSPQFHDSWRGKDPFAIATVGACHILSSFLYFFSELSPKDFSVTITFNPENKAWDTAHIKSNSDLPYVLHGMYSWGTPCHENIRITTSNTILESNSEKVIIQTPRDVFDTNGNFAYPNTLTEKFPEKTSIRNSLEYFLDHVIHNYPLPIDKALDSCKISIRCLEGVKVFNYE